MWDVLVNVAAALAGNRIGILLIDFQLLSRRIDMFVGELLPLLILTVMMEEEAPETVREVVTLLSMARQTYKFLKAKLHSCISRIDNIVGNFERKLGDPSAPPILLKLDYLKFITRNFSDEHQLGTGGFGVVYKGVLRNGKAIAVKKLRDDIIDIHPQNDDQFHKEVAYLIGLKHENIVRLIGYCDESTKEGTHQTSDGNYVNAEKRHRLICFEYLSNKSLDNYLSDESSGLEWHIRYEIFKGICCGLHYLHKKCNILHLDLKPQNILMDDKMAPKIADFGMSRLFGELQSQIITKTCRGTLGYMAPEYLRNGSISTKSDIFSLGVIIIELLIGSRQYPQIYEAPYEHFIENVVRRWRNRLEKTWKDEILETYCRQVKACVEIGMKCVDPDPKNRPAAWDVIEILNNAT